MSYPVRSARQRIQAEHAAVVEGVDRVATRIAEPWDTARTTDRNAVVDGLHEGLEMAGVLEYLPRVLVDVVEAIGCELRAQPVAAPPYVVVTSCGPILRATIDPGRLVIRFDAFEVVRNCDPRQPPAYRRQDGVRVHVSLE
ncbi:hypothetical protein [Natronorubrum daqingense]|uniref:DUF7988 domain-containing protein n=1 Tax=Natronorubrum daqingense TaxID=588898 RepID=A0A1N6XQU0_9EURY|nr:hypothetical protein [Natronorubrum daqingense]APX95885.1 hypothetical protein BB347_04220 [Natronorubrum daqingense]SIR04706.1 hypothetical protein SAMN05421809_0191 [Natronorubrum daqingense]